MIDYTRSGDGKFTEIKINGKKVMKSYLNAVNKAIDSGTFTMRPEGTYSIDDGLFMRCEAGALAYSVFMWTQLWYSRYSMGTGAKQCPTPISTFDNMRYLLKELLAG